MKTTSPSFVRLNFDWNAEPNAPEAKVDVAGATVVLRFVLNPWLYQQFVEEQRGSLTFAECRRWRLGSTNDEGWFMGRCRYSGIAPEWGEFYEIVGDDLKRDVPLDWHRTGPDKPGARHFLFYLKDSTFECLAMDWSFKAEPIDHADNSK
jgi:hypothetical protein